MIPITLFNYSKIAAILSTDSIAVSTTEIHGLLSGTLCGG
ncbi:hypothetical protein BTN50_0257 [Candidatus Enterovibrio altilux]|uniref:Uncharacterized protein n=1 Tax=Candidatus Enterovibrio altilux TaxID=1927128 RepID=A0A291B726_9GAMM|nr:hypothetical protein BTN50_0257 [Candidatus Enterovibrio luxaltus]